MKGHKIAPPTNRAQYENDGKDPRRCFVNVSILDQRQEHSANL